MQDSPHEADSAVPDSCEQGRRRAPVALLLKPRVLSFGPAGAARALTLAARSACLVSLHCAVQLASLRSTGLPVRIWFWVAGLWFSLCISEA